MNESPSYHQCTTQFVKLADHQAALAKKDEELAQLKRWKAIVEGTGTDQEAVIIMAAEGYLKPVVECWRGKVEQLQAELDRVMGLAVKFATRLDELDKGSSVHWNDVTEFLLSPVVQSWRARQGKEAG